MLRNASCELLALTNTPSVRTARHRVLVAAVAMQLGCGSGGGTAGENCDGGCSPADEMFLTSFCTMVEACCVANAARTAPDIAACKRQFSTNGFSRDRALQMACLDELRGLASTGGAGCVPEAWNLASSCQRVLYEPNGTSAPGQACSFRADCAGAPETVTLCVAGACIRMARGRAGDATCLGDVNDVGFIVAALASQPPPLPSITTGVVCERRAGLYCSFAEDKTMQTCSALGTGGAVCDFSRSCASGECYGGDSTSGGLTGTCTPTATVGQRCHLDPPRTLCDETSYCSLIAPTDGACAPKLPAGSSCTDDAMCATGGCASGLCKTVTNVQDVALLGYCARF